MRRTKEDRIKATEKVVARRVRQLKAAKSTVPHVKSLEDHSVMGRCGHKRCICHTSRHKDEHPDDYKEVPEDLADIDDQYNS